MFKFLSITNRTGWWVLTKKKKKKKKKDPAVWMGKAVIGRGIQRPPRGERERRKNGVRKNMKFVEVEEHAQRGMRQEQHCRLLGR